MNQWGVSIKNVEQKSYDFNFIWSTNCLNQHSRLWKHDHSLFYNSSKILRYWMFIIVVLTYSTDVYWLIVKSLCQFSEYLLIVFNFCIWHNGYTWIITVTDIFSYKVNAMTMYCLHASKILIESQTSFGFLWNDGLFIVGVYSSSND